MRTRLRFAFVGLLVASAAYAGDATGCVVRKGLYDTWLASGRRPSHSVLKLGALVGASKATPDSSSVQEIDDEYRTFFQCLSDTALPADQDGGRSLCKEAAGDRIASLVCEAALYIKTNRADGQPLLDAVPKKGGEMIWDLDALADPGGGGKRFPALFAPKGAAYKIIDEIFVLALDDRETAMAKYFHIAGAASGAGAQYTDTQIKILLRESPSLVVKQWVVLRQYQPKLKKLLAELSTELSGPQMNSIRQGIAGFCSKTNLDCPEIQKFFGRPQ